MRRTSRRAARAVACASIAATLLVGCAVGPDFEHPAPPPVTSYDREEPRTPIGTAGVDRQLIDKGALVPSAWWRQFQSSAIDDAVQRALRNNAGLAAAQASLRQSQDALRAGEGVFFPQLAASLSGGRTKTAPITQGSTAPGTRFDVVSLGATVSFPLDVFGGQRRAVEGLAAEAELQRDEADATYVALTADIVETCVARAAYLGEIRATQELLSLERDQLAGAQARSDAGMGAYADVLTLRTAIASTETTLAPLRQRADQAAHLLALLEGTTPAQASLRDFELGDLTLPANVPLSLPSELVRQRPDILAAEAQLHVASANIGVATAAMFPSFGLDANYGSASSGVPSLFDVAGRFWSIGPSLTAPLFRGGSLWFGRKAAIDAFDQQQATYRQTVLAAFAQVADSLASVEHDAEALRAATAARDASRDSLRLVMANYSAGLVAADDVMAADVLYHQAAIGYLQALAARHQDTVVLFAALGGGGWQAEAPPGNAAR